MEPERTGLPLEGDLSVLADYVQAFRPASVDLVRRIAHAIDEHRDRILVPRDEVARDGEAVIERLRLRVADAFFLVRVHLPLVGSVRFLDVDREEAAAVLVLL